VKALTAQEILYLHHRIVEETGGSHGVRDLGLLEAALQRPFAGFGDHQLFSTIPEKVAAFLDALIRNHPFVDANKRTGLSAAVLMLEQNGCSFAATRQEFEDFAVRVATEHLEIEEIASWLEAHVTSVN
jgi:death-on-curing protein